MECVHDYALIGFVEAEEFSQIEFESIEVGSVPREATFSHTDALCLFVIAWWFLQVHPLFSSSYRVAVDAGRWMSVSVEVGLEDLREISDGIRFRCC